MEENRMGYYCVIPSKILGDSELSADEKILYGQISGLANKEGFCWATNEYLATLFADKNGNPKTKRTVINWLNNLEAKNYIKRENIYHKENPNQIIERRIYIVDNFVPRMALEGNA